MSLSGHLYQKLLFRPGCFLSQFEGFVGCSSKLPWLAITFSCACSHAGWQQVPGAAVGMEVPKTDVKEIDLRRLLAGSVGERSSQAGDSEHLIPL